MATAATSPLSMLVQRGLEALATPLGQAQAERVKDRVEALAGGLLVAMGYREIAEDLSLEAVALLSTATVAGLKLIEAAEPGLYRVEDGLYALEDLLRRTAPGAS